MHLIGDNEAWITPPRTGTKAILGALGRDDVLAQNSDKWHFVDPELLGDRKLYMSVRHPYTRLQSHWRLFFNKLMGIGSYLPDTMERVRARGGERPDLSELRPLELSFADYLLILKDYKIAYEKENTVHLVDTTGRLGGAFPFPKPCSHSLKGIPVSRLSGIVRQEQLNETMAKLGYKITRKFIEVVDQKYYSVNMNWYRDNPEFAEIVYDRYRIDFDNFRYIPAFI